MPIGKACITSKDVTSFSLNLISNPLLENSDKPCDTGSPISSLTAEFPPNLVDFSSVDPLWPDKTSPAARPLYGFTRSAILERGRRCLEKLYQRPEELVIVFSHSAFLRLGVTGWWYVNADYRIFEFGDESEEAAAVKGDRRILKHDWETLAGGLGLSWTHTTELGLDLPEDGEKPAGDDNE